MGDTQGMLPQAVVPSSRTAGKASLPRRQPALPAVIPDVDLLRACGSPVLLTQDSRDGSRGAYISFLAPAFISRPNPSKMNRTAMPHQRVYMT